MEIHVNDSDTAIVAFSVIIDKTKKCHPDGVNTRIAPFLFLEF